MVVKITKADSGAYKAQFFNIDQSGQPVPADSVTLDGSTFKMTINSIGKSYEGKLSANGQSISGTWTPGPAVPAGAHARHAGNRVDNSSTDAPDSAHGGRR